MAVGASPTAGNGANSGHARVYQYGGGVWTQVGADIDGEAAGDESGHSVSLNADGTVVAVGANLNDGNGSFSGHVRVYQYGGGVWTQLGVAIDGEAMEDQSGYSVSLNADGTVVAVGALFNDGINGADSGHVRVWHSGGGAWTQPGGDLPAGAG